MTLKRPEDTYVHNGAELIELWRDLMGPGGFGSRQLWLIFIADDGQLSPVVMPIDDLPEDPDDRFLDALREVVDGVLDGTPLTVALLLCRPGPGYLLAADRAWARAVRGAVGGELSPWPMHFATPGHVQAFAPDDLIAA